MILLGQSGSGLSGEGETENKLLAERFGTLFVIGLITHSLMVMSPWKAKTLAHANLLIRRSCVDYIFNREITIRK
jgi:hypothetical protein